MPTIIRHKIRGIRVGKPADHKPLQLAIKVTGKADYRADAETLFGFLFAHVPDGTMQELVRLLAARLSWASDLAHGLPNVAPSPFTWSQLLELKRLLEADPATTSDAVRRVNGTALLPNPQQTSLF